jgi:hypothetical protein
MVESEKWYTISVNNSEKEKILGDLVRFGIPCNSTTSDSGSAFITFPSSYKDRVFNHIGKQSEEYILEPTHLDNTFLVIFTSEEITEQTPPPGDFFEGWADMIPVIQGVKECFDVKIIPFNPHGNVRESTHPKDDKFLYVYFWSTAGPSEKIRLKSVFGLPLVDGQKDALKPSRSWSVIKDESGTEVGEYVDNNLYILFDLPHAHGEGVAEMLTRIMQAYFKIKGKSESELANFYHHIRGDSSSSRSAFARSCNRLHEKKLKSMEESCKTYDNQIDEYNKKLVELTRERDVLETTLVPLKKSIDERKKIAENEYDILMATPHVKDVVVVGETINIFTDMITIRNHDIGEFRIEIHTNGKNSGVKAFNTTHVKKFSSGEQVHHPHIKNDGSCCLGNAKEGVIKLLAGYQYVILGQLMINFLNSYNRESAYLFVEEWD